MKCKDVKNNLGAYLDNECSENLTIEIERHLTACPSCRKEYEILQKTLGLLDRWEVPYIQKDMVPDIKQRLSEEKVRTKPLVILRYVVPVAAAAVVVLAITIRLFTGFVPETKQPALTPVEETAKDKPVKQMTKDKDVFRGEHQRVENAEELNKLAEAKKKSEEPKGDIRSGDKNLLAKVDKDIDFYLAKHRTMAVDKLGFIETEKVLEGREKAPAAQKEIHAPGTQPRAAMRKFESDKDDNERGLLEKSDKEQKGRAFAGEKIGNEFILEKSEILKSGRVRHLSFVSSRGRFSLFEAENGKAKKQIVSVIDKKGTGKVLSVGLDDKLLTFVSEDLSWEELKNIASEYQKLLETGKGKQEK